MIVFDAIAILIAFTSSMILSTWLIRKVIPKLKEASSPPGEDTTSWGLDNIGFWIGFAETVIIFIFVLNDEYSALALLMGAKQLVRKDDMRENPSYYLLGMLVNITSAIFFASLVRLMVS